MNLTLSEGALITKACLHAEARQNHFLMQFAHHKAKDQVGLLIEKPAPRIETRHGLFTVRIELGGVTSPK